MMILPGFKCKYTVFAPQLQTLAIKTGVREETRKKNP